jgi:hypothetical protein
MTLELCANDNDKYICVEVTVMAEVFRKFIKPKCNKNKC